MTHEKVIDTVRKLLALHSNNPEENEAAAALLKAQQMLAKYNLSMQDVSDEDPSQDIIVETFTCKENSGYNTSWRWRLGTIIAKNFRCTILKSGKSILFIGHETDIAICKESFVYIFNVGNKLSQKFVEMLRKQGQPTKGVVNSYLIGFMDGIQAKLDEQCTALMIVVPEDVTSKTDEMSGGSSTRCNMSYRHNKEGYSRGYQDGKDTMTRRQIAES